MFAYRGLKHRRQDYNYLTEAGKNRNVESRVCSASQAGNRDNRGGANMRALSPFHKIT